MQRNKNEKKQPKLENLTATVSIDVTAATVVAAAKQQENLFNSAVTH